MSPVSMLLDVADESQCGRVGIVGRRRDGTRADEAPILSVQAHRAAALAIDEGDQLLVELAQRHFHERHRALVGDAMPAIASRFVTHLAHQLVDAPAAAVHDDHFHPDEAKQRNIAREAGLELRLGHRLSAEAHDDRLAVERAQVGKRFREDAAFVEGRHAQGAGCGSLQL